MANVMRGPCETGLAMTVTSGLLTFSPWVSHVDKLSCRVVSSSMESSLIKDQRVASSQQPVRTCAFSVKI